MRPLLISFLLMISLCPGLFSQTLFSYGSEKVSKEEFLRAYNKNKNASVNQSTALREYLDLYIKFKLKVKAAQVMRLDTLPNLISEYKNFKTQIEESYMDDDKAVDDLVNEVFVRSQKDIHINHLFIQFNSNEPADTLKVYEMVQKANQMIRAGQTFQSIVQQLTQQGINATTGDLGFVTVLAVPYSLENIIYGLKKGGISEPYRARNGYYFFKNIEERKAVGKMKAAQILISLPEGADEQQRLRAKQVADSVYTALKAGASFEEMAKNVSNDKMSYMTGGVMPEFGAGKYTPGFEEQVFALNKDGDLTKPFLTPFGYHIVKRLSRIPVISDSKDATYLFTLKQKVKADSRNEVAQDKFNAQLLRNINYKRNPQLDYKKLIALTDSFISGPANKMAIGNISQKMTLHTFGKQIVPVGEWLNFARNYKAIAGEYNVVAYTLLLDKFVKQSATDYYRSKLENFNPEFNYQVQEFKDGNMLFEIMERNVWNKASADSIGLMNYYQQHKAKYIWEPSADAILITAATAKLAKEVSDMINKGQSTRQVLDKFTTQLQTDSGRYELSQIPVLEKTNFVTGLATAPMVNETDGTASFAVILKLYPGNQQRSFVESRGLIVNDYQAQLEEQWLTELRRKYPVKVNEQVFASLTK